MNNKYLIFMPVKGTEFVFQKDAKYIPNLLNFLNDTINWEDGHFITNSRTFYNGLISLVGCQYIIMEDRYKLFGYDIEIIK